MIDLCEVTQRRARKTHFCEVCGKPIVPGSEYISTKSLQEGRFVNVKEHIHCDAVLNAYTKATGAELYYGRMDEVVVWLRDEVCSECPHESTCRMAGQDIFACTYALRRVLQPTVLRAALESVKLNIEEE